MTDINKINYLDRWNGTCPSRGFKSIFKAFYLNIYNYYFLELDRIFKWKY